ncbi:MAG: DUF4339 domain-containing protein [Oceanicaulis sp.]|uniref:DUF4339 domain-containing protein n=1 Tax=Glycocaulis sp. TaxID=1969725 RepID=UPI0025BE03F3|nr:DUF4339 domain-containing protein [Glycocaulis sp.]MCC5981482.1 DUF4339 domain-containing protein [Oceanicaulis sp.]MCH8522773.1 DUF4339 domain-containing protein [Glycocaulis sp.]
MPRDDGIAMSWFVKVDGRVYGPYTGAQMRAFVGEGRIAAHSLVSQSRDEGWDKAEAVSQFKLWLDEARRSPGTRKPVSSDTRTANFVIIATLGEDSLAGFEAALKDFGDAEPVAPGVWLLRAPSTAATLRNELSHLLARDDRLIVIDASRDRTAWFNFGRDTDQRIRELWGRPQ